MPKQPTCGHPDRKSFSHGDCQQCAQKKYSVRRQERLNEKRILSPPPKKAPQQTDLTKTLLKIYAILAAELKPQHTLCEGHGKITGCTGKATEIHHAKGRRRFLLIFSRYFVYLCRNCHRFCTDNSAEAKKIGLSLPINSRTDFDFTDREKELITQHKLSTPNNK